MEPIISVDNVTLTYTTGGKSRTILDRISFEIGRGEMVAIQGPSGAGKSTLFYLLGGMLRGSTGTITIAGVPIQTLNDFELSVFRNGHLGFVFQQFHLLARANVIQNIMLPTSYPAETNATGPTDLNRAKKLAADLGLSEVVGHMPSQLSGGQQQRVAIARALMRDVDIVLADEPTGSLDSKSADQVMELLHELHRNGKTVVIITHDHEIARRCQRTLHFRDGRVQPDKASTVTESTKLDLAVSSQDFEAQRSSSIKLCMATIPLVMANIWRNKMKSLLTMLGIVVGTAAVLAMLSIGEFAKRRILEGYESLGVNRVDLSGYRNWRATSSDLQKGSAVFQAFSERVDIPGIRNTFPEIERISPMVQLWSGQLSFGGKKIQDEAPVEGTTPDYFAISNATLIAGTIFSNHHVDRRDRVCVVGPDIPKQLNIAESELVGQFIQIARNDSGASSCKVLGVLTSQKSESSWYKPNLRVILPYTTAQTMGDAWNTRIYRLAMSLASGSDVIESSANIKKYFETIYGKSAEFHIDRNATLAVQMRRFLTIFTWLLGVVAFLTLAVGGIGIHNMMLVALSDRLKEIGLRKALGATSRSIRMLFLLESTVLCAVAGVVGIVLGYATCQVAIFAASKLIKGVDYAWIFDPLAFGVSGLAILIVGILSGLSPAWKAERLTVIEALRSES